VKTVLFVGAGRHQRRAILRAKQLGLRVVAVDGKPVRSEDDVRDVFEAAGVGLTVTLTVARGDVKRDVRIQLVQINERT
jgi:S1-C subfamily serine protease